MSTSIERPFFGLRVDNARDGAADRAIANHLTPDTKGLTRAARNANDGISLTQTAGDALSGVNNNLQRIRKLTVQAPTGTNSDPNLSFIRDEIKSRFDEIDRISGQTQFSGMNALPKNDSMKIQIGANDNQTVSIGLQQIDSTTLNLKGFTVSGMADFSAAKLTATNDTAIAAAGARDVEGKQASLLSYTDAASNSIRYAIVGSVIGKYMEVTVVVIGTAAAVIVGAAEVAKAATVNPLKALDAAITKVGEFHSFLGAVQSRLGSAVTNLSNTTANLSEAQSRIRDVDYVTEVSNISKVQIIQQAGNSVLSKASRVP